MTMDGRTQKDFIAEHMEAAAQAHRWLVLDMADGDIQSAVYDQRKARSASISAQEGLTALLHGLHWWEDRTKLSELMGYVG